VNSYEVEAGAVRTSFAGKSVRSIPERIEGEVLHKWVLPLVVNKDFIKALYKFTFCYLYLYNPARNQQSDDEAINADTSDNYRDRN